MENDPKEQDKEPKLSDAVKEDFWDTIPFVKNSAKWICNWAGKELKGMKHGWKVFGFISLAICYAVWWITASVGERQSNERMETTNQIFTASNIFLLGKLEGTKEKLGAAEKENLNLRLEQAKFEKLRVIVDNIYTNAPHHERLDLILNAIASFTNEFKRIGPDAFNFGLTVNQQEISGDTMMIFGSSEPIDIAVKNSGSTTAKGVTVVFCPFTDPSNFVAEGWSLYGNTDQFPGKLNVGKLNLYSSACYNLLPGGMSFRAPFIKIQTTGLPGIIGKSKVLETYIEVFCEGSSKRTWRVKFFIGH